MPQAALSPVGLRAEHEGLEVVADVHTHPGGVGQSQTDRDNPMIPEVGHVALIVPNFADRADFPGDIGIYEYRGRRQRRRRQPILRGQEVRMNLAIEDDRLAAPAHARRWPCRL